MRTRRIIAHATLPFAKHTNQAQICLRELSSRSTVDEAEVAQFNSMAAMWWDASSVEFGALHKMNHVRVPLVTDSIARARSLSLSQSMKSLDGLRILDAGCGGGILAEPLARLGATVVGIDAGEANIGAAEARRTSLPDNQLRKRMEYRCTTVEALAASGETFDCVVSSEVVEHVSDLDTFLDSMLGMVRPGGVGIITTINKTQRSYAEAIVGAERILGLVPRGTHQWEKFVPPQTLEAAFTRSGMEVTALRGFTYNPLVRSWSETRSVDVSYGMAGYRPLPPGGSSSEADD